MKNVLKIHFQRVFPALILGCLALFLSCESTPKSGSSSQTDTASKTATKTPDSIDALEGMWECEDGTGYRYPVSANGKNYLCYHEAWLDVTKEWETNALAQGLTLDELWLKRFSMYPNLPAVDENGTERGMRFSRRTQGGQTHVFVRSEVLISELVAAKNLSCFNISVDGRWFKESGVFHYFSTVVKDRKAGTRVFQLKEGGSGV